jgi:chromosome segregation ATPase
MTMTTSSAMPPASLQALVRAGDWRLSELARCRDDLQATQAGCHTRLQALEEALAGEQRRQQALLGQAHFRVGELAARRDVMAASAAELAQVRRQIDALDLEIESVTLQMQAQQREQRLLEQVLTERQARLQAQQQARTQREADALVAARVGAGS